MMFNKNNNLCSLTPYTKYCTWDKNTLLSLSFTSFCKFLFYFFFQLFLFFQYFILLYSLLSDHVTHFVSIFIHIGYLLNLQSSIKYTFVEGLTRNVCLNTIVYSLLRYNYFNIVLIIIAIFNYKKK